MIYDINAKVNQFVLLASNPYSWEVLVSKSVGLLRGDRIRYNEVNSLGVPTGRVMIGVVEFVGSGDILINEGESVLAYCSVVSESIGLARVGASLIII